MSASGAGTLSVTCSPGRDAQHVDGAGQRRQQRVAPPAVVGAHAPQVAVEIAGRDQPGECELVERRARGVGEALRLDHGLDERLGQHEPCDAQRGRERLAGRAGVDDVVGRERLQRADRPAVVAELAVVVVLDHEARARPLGERRPALRRERRAQADLVGRCHDHRARGEILDARAALVDRDGDDAPSRGGDDIAMQRQARVLHGDVRARHARDQPQRLDVAGADHDPLGLRDDAPRAPEVRGELAA